MRVIFVNRFYWPDEPATAQLLTDLAEALARRGHEIVVITSRPDRTEVPAQEIHQNVLIIRVRSLRWTTRLGLVGKFLDFSSFFLGSLWQLFLTSRRGDVIIPLTDPPLIGVGAWCIARLRSARLIHWIQDIYPEVAIALTGHRSLSVLTPIRNLAWRRADHCVTLGSDMKNVLAGARVPPSKVRVVPNWAPAGLVPQPMLAVNELRATWGLAGKFVVAYSGNLGRVHDLDPILEVAAKVLTEPEIVFLFIGGGPRRSALECRAREAGLSNIQFLPPQPRATLATALSVGDVHFVTLRSGCEHFVYPSKLVGAAAIARPVIFIGPSTCEISKIVSDPTSGFGLSFERHQVAQVAAALLELYRNPSRTAHLGALATAFAATIGDANAAALRWESIFADCDLADHSAA